MLPLPKKELKSYQDAKLCYICRKIFLKKFSNDKNYWKVRDHCRGAAHSIFNLRFNVPNDIPIVFHNRSNYDYNFIIKIISQWIWETIWMSWGKHGRA